jgi:hypothetical protein
MWRFPVAMFFGCFHKRTTLPMTLSRWDANGEISRRTYVTCLTCGEEIAYNWDKMRTEGRLVHEVPQRRATPSLVPAAASIGSWQGKAES